LEYSYEIRHQISYDCPQELFVLSPLLASKVCIEDRGIHELRHQSDVFEKGMEDKSCNLVVIKRLVDNSLSRKAYVAYQVLTHLKIKVAEQVMIP
jgi:hypothetical protein